MLTPRGNYHHHKLPRPGAIGRLDPSLGRPGRWIVESFPLTDSPDPRYAYGIHTVTVRKLGNGQRAKVSGFWFTEEGRTHNGR